MLVESRVSLRESQPMIVHDPEKAAGERSQSRRLEEQHELAGGPLGIFGEKAKRHDLKARVIMELIVELLVNRYPNHSFRRRMGIPKKEINNNLASIAPNLGQVLFVQRASIKPDGGIIEVKDRHGNYRIVLVSESKHQGNDVEKIRDGVKQGKNKNADLMVAGNAIERVHKNIQEFRNLMLDEIHFPYVVILTRFEFRHPHFLCQIARWQGSQDPA